MKREIIKLLNNKNIAFLGFGIENQALLSWLIKQKINGKFTICDRRRKVKDNFKILGNNKNIKWQLGRQYDAKLENFDIIFRIAGYPLFTRQIKLAERKGTLITSASELFLKICPSPNIIGVTGSKGKGTTSALIVHFLKKAKKRVHLGGNIGIPMFSLLSKIKPNDWIVLELSSFQLEDYSVSPHISVITNFSREHLAPADPNNPNYHKSMNLYWQAKANIFKWQKTGDYLVINKSLEEKKILGKAKKIYFTKSILKTKLVGEYNKENIAAAETVAKIIGIKKSIVGKALSSFKGLPHRLEFVGEYKRVKYFDNSFATTPEACIFDLYSFSEPIILFLGGSDKGANFKKLARTVKKQVKFVVLLKGKATPRIRKELLKVNFNSKQMKLANSMSVAVKIAKAEAIAGDVVLLSTACASFGMFKNYKERGDIFQQEIKK